MHTFEITMDDFPEPAIIDSEYRPYRPYPPNDDDEDDRQTRRWWLILISVICVHTVLVLNYMHLQRAQKMNYSSRRMQISRLIVFTLMPTLVIAELLVNVARTFLTLLTMDMDNFTTQQMYQDAKRLFCGILGMHVAPKPTFVEDVEVEVRGNDEVEQQTLLSSQNEQSDEMLPPLSVIHNSGDLEMNQLRWNSRALMKIALLILAVVQAVGTIILFVRAREWPWRYHTVLGLDKRNLMAAISSITCSVTSIILICCRSEWSLKPLSNTAIRSEGTAVKIFILELIIASLINVAPFSIYDDDALPTSWLHVMLDGLSISGFIAIFVIVAVIWLALSMLQSQLKARMPKLNWRFVTFLAALPVVVVTIWIFVDLIIYVIVDIFQLIAFVGLGMGRMRRDMAEDPLQKFIPFC